MHIVVAGGSGFLGQALTDALRGDGHAITILTRRVDPKPGAAPAAAVEGAASTVPPAPGQSRQAAWTPDGTAGGWAAVIDGADVVINLAGDSIATGRWTADKKRRIADSRLNATRSLGVAMARAAAPPTLLINGSAVGYYGPCGDEMVTEAHAPGQDFLAGVCVRWEAEAQRAASRGTRVVCVRTGLVLDAKGGALQAMLLPFKLGVGGPLGAGQQYWPWIHRQDWVDLVRMLVTSPTATGAVNASAPNPVTNAEFTRLLGRALHRPAFLPAPAFALRLALGEMADALLLTGQRAVPAAADRLGYRFTYPDLAAALDEIFG